jgi:phosphate transport system substrate-binding protein
MPVGQIESSYAHTFFKQQVLMQGAYKSGLEATANTLSALDTIAANPGAIGFGEVEVAGEGVRVLPISRNIGTKATLPTRENLLTEEYPLSRFLSVYLVKLPNQELDEVSKNFLSFVLSHEGQTLVKKEGLLPLPAAVAKEELSKLGQ